MNRASLLIAKNYRCFLTLHNLEISAMIRVLNNSTLGASTTRYQRPAGRNTGGTPP